MTNDPLAKGPTTGILLTEGVTITVLRNKKQMRTGLYGTDTAEKGQILKKEAKRFTSEMVFGKKSWWKTWLEYTAKMFKLELACSYGMKPGTQT